jgi:hypothetical protein
MSLYRFHTSVWYLVYRCVHRDFTHQSDNLCTDVSIETPHISLISCVQMCPYRLHILVWHLVYRCVHRDFTQITRYLVYRCLNTDSTHQSDIWTTDVPMRTPHFTLTTAVQICPFRLHTPIWQLVYRYLHKDTTHHSDNLCTDDSIQTSHIGLTTGVQMCTYRLHTSV